MNSFFTPVPKAKIPNKEALKLVFLDKLPKKVTAKQLANHLCTYEEAVCSFIDLCRGESKRGMLISLLFNPHRLDTRTCGAPSVVEAWGTKEGFRKGLSRMMSYDAHKGGLHPRYVMYHAIQVGVNGISCPTEFPPNVARDHFKSFGASRILDPCAGWGGRMIGAASLGAYYEGWEPSTRTFDGLNRLGTWLKKFETGFDFKLHCQPFEDAHVKGKFDLAYTSPPYYDTEHYAPDEATNSMNRYKTFDAWLEGFYLPMVDKALRASGRFCLNVGCRKYDLLSPLKEFGFREIPTRLGGRAGLGKKSEGKESFYLIQ